MMALPKQLRQHKDKIIILGIAAGGLYTAALKFSFASVEQLQGWISFVVMGVAALGLYTFYDGYINAKKRMLSKKAEIPGLTPSMENLGYGPRAPQYATPPPMYQAPPQSQAPMPEAPQGRSPQDIFEGFN